MGYDAIQNDEPHHHDWLFKKIEERISKLMTGEIEPSVTIPSKKSLEISHIVSPPEKTQRILEGASIIANVECDCRKKSTNPCDAPLYVCLIIDPQIAKDSINEGTGKEVTVSDAMNILNKTTEIGLVHMLLHFRGGAYHAICSCCSCCCHDLVALLKYNHKNIVEKSNYIAAYNEEECIDCQNCIDFCHFKAWRQNENKGVHLDEKKCYGCGVCVVHCPTTAIKLEKR